MHRLSAGSRRRVIAALGAIAAAAAAIGAILATGLTGSTKAASTRAKGQGATAVQRRDLIATDTQPGKLGYANPKTVFNRMSGTVTWLPAVGRVIQPGQTLYRVDGAPVVLFDGALPAYRDLSEAATGGPDIEQLKRNLVALGFDAGHQITINQTFDAATSAAVQRWQGSVGESQTGAIKLGQIVFLPGAQRVTAVNAALGSTGGSSSAAAASGSATTTSAPVQSRPQFVSLTTDKPHWQSKPTKSSGPATSTKPTNSPGSATSPKRTNSSSSATSQQSLAALLALLKAETLQLQKSRSSSAAGSGSSGAGSGSSGARSGGASSATAAASGAGTSGGSGASSGSAGSSGAGATAQPILQTTSTQLVVTVDLDATMQTEAVLHAPVTVQLPDGTTVAGKITRVSPVAQTTTSASSSAGAGGASNTPSSTIPVTIELTGHGHVAGLDQAAVSVHFEQQKATNVLSVPVSALLATAGGGYAVQEATPPNKLLPVTPGLFAAGYVQISGPGIFPGIRVTDSQG